jgi:beta-N-acetylhexosaminidase
MQKLGNLYHKNPWEGLQVAKAAGFILASELKACGVDFSYTPVLDLDYGKSEVIGNRAFSGDSHITAILAGALIDGLKLAGMASCGKHFPGHGFVEADSHTAIPVDERDFQQIWNNDIVPYMLLLQKLDSIMPAHIIYKQIAKEPAGFSSFWLQDVLRSRLEFDGIIFSDDLAMEGASVAGNVVQGAQAALSAGCDMVLICNKPDMADELLAGLQYKPEYAKASQHRLNKIMPTSFRCDLNWDKLQEDDLYIDSKSILIKHGLI